MNRIVAPQAVLVWAMLFFIVLESTGQGYYNQENFGNRSILLNGNVTGSVDDLGMTYYNPARLAIVPDPGFTINAKAYQLSSLNIKNVFGNDNSLSDSQFRGVPSLLAGTFNIKKWEKHHFAYAFLSRYRDNLNINTTRELSADELPDIIEGVDRFVSSLRLNNSRRDEWFGASWGTKIKDNLSIGVSAFISVFNVNSRYDLRYATLEDEGNTNFYNNVVSFGQSSYGMFWKLGLAWELEKFDFGLNVDFPYLSVVNNGNFVSQEFLAGLGEGRDIFEYAKYEDLKAQRKEPLGISLGAGIPLGRSRLHAKVDWHAGVGEYERLSIPQEDDMEEEGFTFTEELKSVINFGLGAEIYLNEKLNFYASFGTDFSPIVTNANIFDLVGTEPEDTNITADYFHYAFGLDFKFKRSHLTLGTTYSTASSVFKRPVEFPDPDAQFPVNDDPAEIIFNRWRFIVGLEFPLFGYNVDFK